MILAAASPAELFAAGGFCIAVGGGLVGLLFRGAAMAWRDERDAAVDKSDRLETQVNHQAAEILSLRSEVSELKARNVDQIADELKRFANHTIEEHKQMVETMQAMNSKIDSNTTAIEFIGRQTFPHAIVPLTEPPTVE